MAGLLWGLITLFVILWVLGLALHVGGALIHVLIVIAIVMFLFNLVSGRGARV